jgi:four helix bundle protein
MKDFKKLLIWEKGMDIVVEAYNVAKLLPVEEKYSIKSQLTSAAISIPQNIAEGSSRRSTKDYIRFLEYALGSAFEVETIVLAIIRVKLLEISKIMFY